MVEMMMKSLEKGWEGGVWLISSWQADMSWCTVGTLCATLYNEPSQITLGNVLLENIFYRAS